MLTTCYVHPSLMCIKHTAKVCHPGVLSCARLNPHLTPPLSHPACAASLCSILEVQAVPETSGAARYILQSSETVGGYYGNAVLTSYGYGYGSSGRHLLQSSSDTAGSYGMGTYGMSTGGYGYGYGSGRRLIEDDIILEPSDPLLQYAEQRAAADAAAAAPKHAQPHGSSSSKQQLSIPAGKCYCRYDADFNTWALAEDTCKEALYQRCKVGACCYGT